MNKIITLGLVAIMLSCAKPELECNSKTLTFSRGYAKLAITEQSHPYYWNKVVGDTINGYELIDGVKHPHIIESIDCN